MKRLALMLLFCSASFAATDYSGIWNGQGGKNDVRYGLVPMTVQLVLQQGSSAVSGTLKMGNANPVPITSGQVSGNQITVVANNNSAQITGVFSIVSPTQLQGNMTTSTGKTFSFVLTKSH